MVSRALLFATAVVCFASSPSAAQENFYLRPYFNFEGPQPLVDLIIKERRQGRELVAATADFCIPVRGSFERVVMELKQDANKLEGTAVSTGSRTRVSLRLVRAAKDDEVAYAGTFLSGLKEYAVMAEKLHGVSEASFLEDPQPGPELLEAPEHFLKASPQALAVRIKHGTLAEWIKLLRGNNFSLDLQAADDDNRKCSELRFGYQAFRVTFPPDQLQIAMAKLKAMPMVIAVGYASINHSRATIRAARKGWLAGDKLDRNRLSAHLGRVVAKALGATLVKSDWDALSGELVLQLKRPSLKFPGLGFTDVIPIRLLVSPERPGGSEYFLIWLADTMGQLVDEGPGPRVALSQLYFYAGPAEGLPLELDEVAAAIAEAFKGRKWNPEKEVWE